jgi:hypothetical protein
MNPIRLEAEVFDPQFFVAGLPAQNDGDGPPFFRVQERLLPPQGARQKSQMQIRLL